MRRSLPRLIVLSAFAGLCLGARVQAQSVTSEQLTTYTKAYVAIGKLRDQYEEEFAQPKNKKPEALQQLHDAYRQQIVKIIQDNGLTEQVYNQITFLISTQPAQRQAFEKAMGIEPPPPPPAAAASMPANPHVGHVLMSFNGTPNAQGLLPTAIAEAQVVVQHAGLAAKSSGNLDAMKQHATHIIHAIDPAEAAEGPGPGYGLRKAAAAVATHIELAAKAEGAVPNVTTHSTHIAASAKNTVTRAEQILALAKQIQSAGSASDAAALVAKLNTVAGQLLPGFDSNGDGKISWEEGEGGLDQADQHLKLMTAPPK